MPFLASRRLAVRAVKARGVRVHGAKRTPLQGSGGLGAVCAGGRKREDSSVWKLQTRVVVVNVRSQVGQCPRQEVICCMAARNGELDLRNHSFRVHYDFLSCEGLESLARVPVASSQAKSILFD